MNRSLRNALFGALIVIAALITFCFVPQWAAEGQSGASITITVPASVPANFQCVLNANNGWNCAPGTQFTFTVVGPLKVDTSISGSGITQLSCAIPVDNTAGNQRTITCQAGQSVQGNTDGFTVYNLPGTVGAPPQPVVQHVPATSVTPTAQPTAAANARTFIPANNKKWLSAPLRVVDTRGAPFGPIGYQPNGQRISAGQLPDGSVVRYLLTGQVFEGTVMPTNLTGVDVTITSVQNVASGGFLTLFSGSELNAPNATTLSPSAPVISMAWSGPVSTTSSFPGTIGVKSVGLARDIVIDVNAVYTAQ